MPGILYLTRYNKGAHEAPVRVNSDHVISYTPEGSGTVLTLISEETLLVEEPINIVDAMFLRIGFQAITKELHEPPE